MKSTTVMNGKSTTVMNNNKNLAVESKGVSRKSVTIGACVAGATVIAVGTAAGIAISKNRKLKKETKEVREELEELKKKLQEKEPAEGKK